MTRRVHRFAPTSFVYAPPGCETIPPGYEPDKIQVFDDGAEASDHHGELGPTHIASFRIPEYDYQIVAMLDVVTEDYSARAVRALAPDGREWRRIDGRWVPHA